MPHPVDKSISAWFALRNPVFCRLWLASVLSGTFVSAQDVTATWLMNDLGASSFRTLMEEVQAACRRNGAFQCRVDESLDHPGLFRLDYMVSTWA
jgi:hypothetical protein